MSKQSDFEKFLSNIEPSKTTKDNISSIQNNIREYLKGHDEYKDKFFGSFLIGSYAKKTCIRPKLNDNKPDVDIAIITNHTSDDNSKDVLDELYNVLKEKYKNISKQKRSIGIEFNEVEVDIVPLIKKENSEIYMIGEKETGEWYDTNPKKHLEWTTEVNKDNNQKYVPIVKMFKWWRRINCPNSIKYPKGILLEKIIADNISSTNSSYETILYNTMKSIENSYNSCIKNNTLPVIYDPGIIQNNLFDGYTFENFKSFYKKIQANIKEIEYNNFSNDSWRKYLGNEFPKDSIQNSFLEGLRCLNIDKDIFNVPHKITPSWHFKPDLPVLNIKLKCLNNREEIINYIPNGIDYLSKNINLYFEVEGIGALVNECSTYWQIVNTGEEAARVNCLRGDKFEVSNNGVHKHHEMTAYKGMHWVQAFLIKDNICIGKSNEIIINVK